MRVRIGLTLAVLLSVAWLTSAGARAQQDEDNGGDKKLQTLLTQRRDTLQERLKFVQAMHANGSMELRQVTDAWDALLNAELELASTTEQRLALLLKKIESFRELESYAKTQRDSGTQSIESVLLATAARLQAEIDYERERTNAVEQRKAAGQSAMSETQAAKTYPVWEGEWERSEELNRLLGYEGDDSYTEQYPTSFRLSLSETIGHGMEAGMLKTVFEVLFKRMEHRVVATGKWEITFENASGVDEDSGYETSCFVTEHDGSTFLWVPVPFAILYGGKLSFLEGSDHAHDAIVIDFNTMPKHLAGEVRASDTVAYKRRSD